MSKCQKCGNEYEMFYVDDWEVVVPYKYLRKQLCIDCYIKVRKSDTKPVIKIMFGTGKNYAKRYFNRGKEKRTDVTFKYPLTQGEEEWLYRDTSMKISFNDFIKAKGYAK